MGFWRLFRKKVALRDSGFLSGAVDRHTHILYGVDDGIRTEADALAVLDYLERSGVKEIWCTPHVMEDVPNTTEGLRRRFDELKERYNGPVVLNLAAEYMLDTLFRDRLAGGDLLTMPDDVLLVETSVMAPPYDLDGMLQDIMSAGYRPLLAHPERYRFLTVRDYARLHGLGVRFQLNLGSLVGYYGDEVRKKALGLLDEGLYDAYGSDCHRLTSLQKQFERAEVTSDVVAALKRIGM